MPNTPSKVPGSNNPPAPWDSKGFNGMNGMNTTSPKMSQVMGKPGQAPSPIANEVNPSMDVEYMELGEGICGVINPGKNVNGSGTGY